VPDRTAAIRPPRPSPAQPTPPSLPVDGSPSQKSHLPRAQMANHSNHRQNAPNHADAQPKSKGNPAPHFGVVGCNLRPSDVPGLQFPVHLRCINDGWNTRRKAAKNGSQDREHEIILDCRAWRQNNSRRLRRSRRDGHLQIPSALNAHRGIVGITGSALRTEHCSPPGREVSLQPQRHFSTRISKFARNILFAIARVNALN